MSSAPLARQLLELLSHELVDVAVLAVGHAVDFG